MLCRYFADCQALAISVPDHRLTGAKERATSLQKVTLPLWQQVHGTAALSADLTSVASALRTMAESLTGALGQAEPGATVPASRISYNLVQAAMRQRDFYYNVSLPHYEHESIQETGITRYATPAVDVEAHNSRYRPCVDVLLFLRANEIGTSVTLPWRTLCTVIAKPTVREASAVSVTCCHQEQLGLHSDTCGMGGMSSQLVS
jgi:hypothetical protein